MIEVEIKMPVSDLEMTACQLRRMGFIYEHDVIEEDRYFDNEAGQIRANHEALRVRTITKLAYQAANEQTSPNGSVMGVGYDTEDVTTMITFKGPKLDQVSMTRQELETKVDSAEVGIGIFEGLGFHVVDPVVIKHRTEYVRGNMTACLDRVEDLGDFLELEIMEESPDPVPVERFGKPDSVADAMPEENRPVSGHSLSKSVTGNDAAAGDARAPREIALSQIAEVLTALGYSMEDTTRTSYLGMLQRKGRKKI